MKTPKTPKRCRVCKKEAGPDGELWTTIHLYIDHNLEVICSKCFQKEMETNKTGREAIKDNIADQAFLRQEQYESERDYHESQGQQEEL